MTWTRSLVGVALLGATAAELAVAFAIRTLAPMAFQTALAPVLIISGVGWTLAGMFVSGPARLTPPLTTAPGYGLPPAGQPSLSSELYTSSPGAVRLARQSLRALARGQAFVVPAVLYGLANFVVGLVLAA